ncbi:CPBP family intramembrane metalloprotease [Pseudoxanthomonas sp. SGNA-20]|uniref:CPBP family intramembrane glutamic endopeptidase n=1 Tax=Pseudoxanthomonas sp. SGNA-20 TaxID=2493088 RepID=UPI000F638EC8|nr:type II CAAX endopeptidase family protein [Pseudoxanthomonas sp. SGNA-20]RRN59366.1 CPBP family intramembrane metalloprotease [Pseudoxanthomonas sp. SGNA-20]
MSEPAPAPPAHAAGAVPTARLPRVLGAFALDLVVAVGVLLAVTFAVMMAWGAWRAFSAMPALGGSADAASLARAVGEPGALVQMLAAILGMSAAALVLYFWRRPATAHQRQWSWQAARSPRTWVRALGAGVLVFAGSSLASWLISLTGAEPVPSNLALVDEAARRWPVFLVLFAVVLAPAYEELLFRRVLFGRFLDAGRPWLGGVLSSLAFALMHEVPGVSANPPLAVAMLLAVYSGMGAVFAWLYWRSGTLWAPIAAHAANNGLALLVHGLA